MLLKNCFLSERRNEFILYRAPLSLILCLKKKVCACVFAPTGIEHDGVLNENVVLNQNNTGPHVPGKLYYPL